MMFKIYLMKIILKKFKVNNKENYWNMLILKLIMYVQDNKYK